MYGLLFIAACVVAFFYIRRKNQRRLKLFVEGLADEMQRAFPEFTDELSTGRIAVVGKRILNEVNKYRQRGQLLNSRPPLTEAEIDSAERNKASVQFSSDLAATHPETLNEILMLFPADRREIGREFSSAIVYSYDAQKRICACVEGAYARASL
jgi:hypothetical protein